jgi:hypothetical protein
LENGIVHGGAELADLLVSAGGIHAIGEQNDEKTALGIDPK